MRMDLRVHGGVVLAALISFLGLAPRAAAMSPPAMRQAEADTIFSDATITEAVHNELLLAPRIPPNQVSVTTTNGVVTLRGEVPSLLAAESAGQKAMETAGVRSVVNDLRVSPPHRLDSAVAADINEALTHDPATESYEVHVTVSDGVATLRGNVDSWAEKALSRDVAVDVRGVRKVVDRLTVTPLHRSDMEIQRDVEGLLSSAAPLVHDDIDVTVKSGQVTLSGAVGSPAERAYAKRRAWVAGVGDVNADGLKVQWQQPGAMTSRSTPQPSDSDIRTAILDAYALSPRVHSFNPTVEVKDGKVTLTGVVTDYAARRAAERIALNTVGVSQVENHLTVRSAVRMSDSALATSVHEALQRDPLLSGLDIHAVASNGIVTLSGTVDTQFDRERAEEVAGRLISVVDVVNDIQVDTKQLTQTDKELKEAVQQNLFWNRWVTPGDVDVAVQDGAVTLSGTVDSWFERRQAEREAYQAGATDVLNDLLVSLIPGPSSGGSPQ